MNIYFFVLGVLSIIFLAMLSTIVWGVLKIMKISKTVDKHDLLVEEFELDAVRTDLESSIAEVHERIDTVDRSVSSDFDDIHNRVDNLNSYIDHRIDKLIDAQNANVKTKKTSK